MNQPQSDKKRFALSELKTNEHTIMAVLAVVVGLAGGFGAVGFRYLIDFFQTLAYGSHEELLHVVLALPWYMKVWVPAAGGLVVGPLVDAKSIVCSAVGQCNWRLSIRCIT